MLRTFEPEIFSFLRTPRLGKKLGVFNKKKECTVNTGQLRSITVIGGQLKSIKICPLVHRSIHQSVSGSHYGIDEAMDKKKPLIDLTCGGY